MYTYRWSRLVGCSFFCLWFHYFTVYWFQEPTQTLDLLSILSLTKWRITWPLYSTEFTRPIYTGRRDRLRSFQETLFPPNQFFFQFILSQWILTNLFINNDLMLKQAQTFDERGQEDLLYTINSLILWG